MLIRDLHGWGFTVADTAEMSALQDRLARQLVLTPPEAMGVADLDRIRTVAGADVSYNRGSDRLFAAVVVLSFPELQEITVVSAEVQATLPYIPGFLTFREAPALLAAFAKLDEAPDVVLVDGHGVAHPRHMGIASHVGLFLDVPTFGCAKKKLRGQFQEPGPAKGDRSELRLRGERVGFALRTRPRAGPMFISPGHRIDAEAALQVALRCTGTLRLPVPTARAHQAVNAVRVSSTGAPGAETKHRGTEATEAGHTEESR